MLAERGYLPAGSRAHGVRLVAVADPDERRCATLAAGLPRYPGAAELLAAEEVDGLVLATPVAAHLADAVLAAAAGLVSLVEKPPAADGVETAALAALDPLPSIGFNLRFDRDLQRLRAAVPPGTRVHLALDLHNEADSWRSYVVADDALLRLGPHLVDLVRWLTGSELEQVRATELTHDSAVLELEAGRTTARISLATNRPPVNRVEIRGADGTPIGRAAPGLVRRVIRRVTEGDSLVRRLALQLEAFAGAARGEPQPLLATAHDGAAVMAAIDAARRSGGAWIPVAPLVAGVG